MSDKETILITGASGTVAKAAGAYLHKQGYKVIGVSRSVKEDPESYTETYQMDLLDTKDIEDLEEILKEASAVFHLAWNIAEENFDTHTAWKYNMVMFNNTIKAAYRAGVPILINGSSIHAGIGDISAYTVDANLATTPEPYKSSIDPKSDFDLRKNDAEKLLDPREENPDSPYGWTKIMTERKLREAVKNNDFDIGVSIRIGGVNSEDKNKLEGEPFYPTLYWSHKDLGRTIENILTSDVEEKHGYHQFYGVSDNKGRIFNIENSFVGETH